MASNLSNIDQVVQLEADEIHKRYRDELGTILTAHMDDLMMQDFRKEMSTNKRLLRKYNELQKANTNNTNKVS